MEELTGHDSDMTEHAVESYWINRIQGALCPFQSRAWSIGTGKRLNPWKNQSIGFLDMSWVLSPVERVSLFYIFLWEILVYLCLFEFSQFNLDWIPATLISLYISGWQRAHKKWMIVWRGQETTQIAGTFCVGASIVWVLLEFSLWTLQLDCMLILLTVLKDGRNFARCLSTSRAWWFECSLWRAGGLGYLGIRSDHSNE